MTAFLAFRAGELRQEILIYSPQYILGAVFLVAQADVANKVNQLPQALLIQAGMNIILRQYTL